MMTDPVAPAPARAPDPIRGLPLTPRPAMAGDAPACAAILQDWLDATPWMPDLHSPDETIGFARTTLIGTCATHVIGDPVAGFLSRDAQNTITALYVAKGCRRMGFGAALLDQAKSETDHLSLWVFQANTDAIRFYHRHGFAEIRRSDGENAEGLPDLRMEWHR